MHPLALLDRDFLSGSRADDWRTYSDFDDKAKNYGAPMRRLRVLYLLLLVLTASPGCALFPDVMHEPQYHNPFPQLYRVAVLPFGNQSKEPTIDGDAIALAYYNELQAIRGFEVMPVGVTKRLLQASQFEPRTPDDFQKLARFLGVDAVVVGSVTEYTPYYPPTMGLAVNWYAGNPSFHPVPAGYGLPWGTPHESDIPEELVFDAEFALAREQLATQTPDISIQVAPDAAQAQHTSDATASADGNDSAAPGKPLAASPASGISLKNKPNSNVEMLPPALVMPPAKPSLPAEWPDPRGFIPPAPSLTRPAAQAQLEPVLTHTRVYHGSDADFTAKLEKYYYFRDDARFGGWQSYLQRSDDFARFCCHLHITEMLAARGGAGKPRVVYRWPISRYER